MRTILTGLCFVLLAGCVPNGQPARPETPTGPAAVRPQESAEFAATTVDPDGNAVQFRFAWQLGDTSDWSDVTPSGDTARVSHAFTAAGAFEIRCQARDIRDALSEWSDALAVLVGNPPRQPTRPDGVSGGWLDSSYQYQSVATDLDLDRIRYVFDWGDGSADTTGFYESGQYAEQIHSWSAVDSFDVRVRAFDAAGLESEWSETRRVGIRDPAGPGVLLWHYELPDDDRVLTAPAIDAQGRLLFGTANGVLYCLESGAGVSWTFLAGDAIHSTPAVGDDGSVVFGSDDGRVYCLTSEGGSRWDYYVGSGVRAAPALAANGAVHVGAEDGRLYSFDAAGALRWSYATGGSIVSSAAIAVDGTVYFGSTDSFVYALNPDSTLKWRYATGGPVEASPAIGGDGTVYVTSWDGYLYALNPDGTLRWREALAPGTVSSPVVGSNGFVYAGSADGRLLAFYSIGGPVWSVALGQPVETTPLLDGGGLALVMAGRRLCVVDSYGQGSVDWDFRLAGSGAVSVAVGADGTIYCGDDAGFLYAIRGKGVLDSGPWPKFRHDARNTGRSGGF